MGIFSSLGIRFLKGYYRAAERERIAAKRFNTRWERLNNILRKTANEYGNPLESVFDQMTEIERDNYLALVDEVLYLGKDIKSNINIARNRDLSKYATAIKRFSMKAIKLCKKYETHLNIVSVEYNAKQKILKLNGKDLYYFG
jgi:hypothetical protein